MWMPCRMAPGFEWIDSYHGDVQQMTITYITQVDQRARSGVEGLCKHGVLDNNQIKAQSVNILSEYLLPVKQAHTHTFQYHTKTWRGIRLQTRCPDTCFFLFPLFLHLSWSVVCLCDRRRPSLRALRSSSDNCNYHNWSPATSHAWL